MHGGICRTSSNLVCFPLYAACGDIPGGKCCKRSGDLVRKDVLYSAR